MEFGYIRQQRAPEVGQAYINRQPMLRFSGMLTPSHIDADDEFLPTEVGCSNGVDLYFRSLFAGRIDLLKMARQGAEA